MITDGHNHTKHFSVDAGQTIEELINEAKSKGFNRIGITEHYEIDYVDDGLNWMFDLKEYNRTFEEWRKKAGDFELLKGIEFGYQTHTAKTIDEVVGQQHILAKDKLLYRAIKADKLSSIIFYLFQ